MSDGDRTSEWRRRRAVLAVLVVVSLLIVTALVLWAVRQGADDPSQAALAGARSTTRSPVPLGDGEAYVRTKVLPSGDLLVTHWIESPELVFSVELAAPPITGTEDVTADQVRVTADGLKAFGPEQIRSGWSAKYAFVGAKSLEIRYRLTGVIQRSSSAPGRALAPMTALDVTFVPASQHVTRAVIAPEVLSLACSRPASFTPIKPCGTRGPDGEWTAELFGAAVDDQVIAQLTLLKGPAPRGQSRSDLR